MTSHANCSHEATRAGRARCRRANGAPTTARPRWIDFSDKEKHPADRSRCCYNCVLREIAWRGRNINGMMLFVCDKCLYVIGQDEDRIPYSVKGLA